jgi:hypothetical protein
MGGKLNKIFVDTKAILADANAGPQDDMIPQRGVTHSNVAADSALGPNEDMRPDDAVPLDDGARANSHALQDHRIGPHKRRVVHARRAVHERGSVPTPQAGPTTWRARRARARRARRAVVSDGLAAATPCLRARRAVREGPQDSAAGPLQQRQAAAPPEARSHSIQSTICLNGPEESAPGLADHSALAKRRFRY